MSDCRKCKNPIPSQVLIDGRQRNLCNRVYCLTCSPFGIHNTRRLDYVRQEGKELLCSKCRCLYIYKRGKGMTTRRCASCLVSTRRDVIKRRSVDYKGGCCVLCGYSRCMSSLVFHHLNPSEKKFGIGSNYNKSWVSIKEELDKCVLLCHNCHSEYHEGLVSL